MTGIDLRECESCGDVVQQYPLFAGILTVIIGAITYAGITLASGGVINPVEVGLFAVVFGVGYTGANYFWRTSRAA